MYGGCRVGFRWVGGGEWEDKSRKKNTGYVKYSILNVLSWHLFPLNSCRRWVPGQGSGSSGCQAQAIRGRIVCQEINNNNETYYELVSFIINMSKQFQTASLIIFLPSPPNISLVSVLKLLRFLLSFKQYIMWDSNEPVFVAYPLINIVFCNERWCTEPHLYSGPLTRLDAATHIRFQGKFSRVQNHLSSIWVRFASPVIVVPHIPAFKG